MRVRVLAAGNPGQAGLTVSASGRFALLYLLRPDDVLELNLVSGQLRTVPVAAAGSLLGAAW